MIAVTSCDDDVGENEKAYNGNEEVAEKARFRIKCYLILNTSEEHYYIVSIGPGAGITVLNKTFRVLLWWSLCSRG